MKVRQDAWTDENDLLLAETVLRHVREGSTQLNAFEEVGDKLDRTSAACGFRWNAVVRHRYEKALQLAKKQRKQRQRILGKDQSGKKKLLYSPPVPTIDDIGMPPSELMETSVELTEMAQPDSMEAFQTMNSLELQDAFGLQGLQELQESMLFNDSPDIDDSPSEPSSESETEVVSESQAETAEVSESTIQEETEVETTVQKEMARTYNPAPMTQQSRVSTGLTLGHVIAYLQNLNNTNFHADIYKSENERLKREIHGLRKENEELKEKVKKLEQNTFTMQEDYETLMKIMNRARKLVLFEEEERPATKFKMDRNGNLEKVAE
ncbi:RsfA family transcriptional regulator [Mesobacillus foraminis]|uniref:RsfA family transcription factor n=1 Tax=Mesobacillus foraminis TaxID=279826 RepID=A0A4R2BAQ7_9BACI|nr:RsfA family transcriptional regulator [Mesobacillus foraminis]TCN24011.1 RsfA family transcription factor [Mesobacillus foraminis]